MIRQLFSSAGGVSEAGRTRGAAPFSLALHAVAIGGLLFLSSQKVASTDVRPPVPVYQAPPAEATPVPVVGTVKSENKAPSGRRAPAAPKVQPPSTATPQPFVPPTEPVDNPSDPYEIDPAADHPSKATGSTGNCAGCLVGPESIPGPPSDAPPALVRISTIDAPRKMRDAAPRYPPLAKNIHLEGDVVLDCTIGVDGHVRQTKVIQGHPLLTPAAIEAVQQWQYTPTRLNGQPVSVLLTVTVKFRLVR
jgi:TonB family protein